MKTQRKVINALKCLIRRAEEFAHIFHDDPPTELNGDETGSLPPGTPGRKSRLLRGERAEGFCLEIVGHVCAGLATGIIG